MELAAGYAAGGLEGAERDEFRSLLRSASTPDRAEVAAIMNGAALVSLSLPREKPSTSLRQKVLDQINARPKAPPSGLDLLKFLREKDQGDWIPLKVPGAYVKLLFMDDSQDYVVALGKLDPGAHYPAHVHEGPEQIYVLSGDLFIGEQKLVAGDFHAAAAGSSHGVNHSEEGCTILAVLTKKNMMAQFAAH